MARTVAQAFNEFLTNSVRVQPADSDRAKTSRDNLVAQIRKFPEDGLFPALYPDYQHINFGSFDRKTKHHPLDDIDTMIIMRGQGAQYQIISGKVVIYNAADAAQFRDLCNDNSNELNSIKVVNRFKEYLKDVHHFRNAKLHRDGEAVRLELDSYNWSYDIVPSFITSADDYNRTYYVIPDGKGQWKFTDPRKDKARVININNQHVVSVYDMIRLVKYWNSRPTMPSMGSYLMENMVLDYFAKTHPSLVMQTIPYCMGQLLTYISQAVYLTVDDPKQIQGDLNQLSWSERVKIANRAVADKDKIDRAINYDNAGYPNIAIGIWKEVFGNNFPSYTA